MLFSALARLNGRPQVRSMAVKFRENGAGQFEMPNAQKTENPTYGEKHRPDFFSAVCKEGRQRENCRFCGAKKKQNCERAVSASAASCRISSTHAQEE